VVKEEREREKKRERERERERERCLNTHNGANITLRKRLS
jgi:hypothetical protein